MRDNLLHNRELLAKERQHQANNLVTQSQSGSQRPGAKQRKTLPGGFQFSVLSNGQLASAQRWEARKRARGGGPLEFKNIVNQPGVPPPRFGSLAALGGAVSSAATRHKQQRQQKMQQQVQQHQAQARHQEQQREQERIQQRKNLEIQMQQMKLREEQQRKQQAEQEASAASSAVPMQTTQDVPNEALKTPAVMNSNSGSAKSSFQNRLVTPEVIDLNSMPPTKTTPTSKQLFQNSTPKNNLAPGFISAASALDTYEPKGFDYGDEDILGASTPQPFVSNVTKANSSSRVSVGGMSSIDYGEPSGNFGSSNHDSYGSSSSTAYPSSTATSQNHNSSNDYGGGDPAWGNNSYDFNSSNPPPGTNDKGAPNCPGHGMPCRQFTASTAANLGRAFYKCSLPAEQACDFFEWADGNQESWNGGFDGVQEIAGECLDFDSENRRKFGHPSFRPGQREVIEQAMRGRDVFVLMPTGGGKSLCYQLPAWCCPGLSIVVSPLLSLIQDQVQSLTKLGVPAEHLSGNQDYHTVQMGIIQRIKETEAHGGVKLLYLTPEKLSSSNMMKGIIRQLYNKGLISRFIIDEAHCLSDWGHDFRPDYNQLGMLRREFPKVPLMALTATANEKVVNDAIRALGMRNQHLYRSSFNRPNLHYEVRKKDGKCIESLASHVASKPNASGVIYCLSRKNCEELAQKLEEKLTGRGLGHIRVSFYHAELDAEERKRRHQAWSSGTIAVLCATVAFGMGIDKPDVRYVVHYSMPKSITHYYQESGRAGRDGEKADCILYYTYKDKKTLESMIVKSAPNPNSQSVRRKIDQLYTCVRYCENMIRCRRTMQLEFFGEHFDKSKCNQTCDNCRSGREAETRDMTPIAQGLIQLFSDVSQQKNGRGVTMAQLADLYKGSKSKSSTKFLNLDNLKGYGAGSKMKRGEIDNILHSMVFERIFIEVSTTNAVGFNSEYINLGENSSGVQSGTRRFNMEFARSCKKAPKEKVAKAKKAKASDKKTTSRKRPAKSVNDALMVQKRPSDGGGLQFEEIPSSQELSQGNGQLTGAPGDSKAPTEATLPQKYTQKLMDHLKELIQMWAKEEQMAGNTVFYWNILSNEVIRSISNYVPTSMDELSSLHIGENKLKEYGERLVRQINSFVEKNALQRYVAQRPQKRQRTSISVPAPLLPNPYAAGSGNKTNSGPTSLANAARTPVIDVDNNEFDEFDDGMDDDEFDIDIPGVTSAAPAQSKAITSPFFR